MSDYDLPQTSNPLHRLTVVPMSFSITRWIKILELLIQHGDEEDVRITAEYIAHRLALALNELEDRMVVPPEAD